MGLMMILFWGVVIFAIVYLVRTLGRPVERSRSTQERDSSQGDGRAVGILEERFARGEIDEAEYRRRLDVLRRQREPGG